ncbi:hypothetical protein SGRIM128S_03675 [Streptomyces griseomycini]
MPLSSVVWSGSSRPVTVTSPFGGAGISGNALWLRPSEGTQPRLTMRTLPSSSTKGVRTW